VQYAKQQVLLSSYNMFTTATSALASNPQLKQVVLMEATSRYNNKEELNRYGNLMLHQAKEESSSVHKAKVTIVVHNLDFE
jgi:aspartyl/asparaginyl beta-hydroxylase (cupin superfamily)